MTKKAIQTASEAIAARVNQLGFSKNGKPMTQDQAAEVFAALAGYRNTHVLYRNMRTQTPLALLPVAPEESGGTDFQLQSGVGGIWIKVDQFSVHVVRGSFPQANDGGLRVFVYPYGDEDNELDSLCVVPSEEDDCQDEADSLGVDLDDVKFWVGLHYKVNYDAEPADRKIDWLHRYREANGLEPKAQGSDPAPYLVSEGWSHIFDTGERTVRFVLDTRSMKMVEMQFLSGTGWVAASEAMKSDVLDSILHANADAIDRPDDYGCELCAEMPTWQ